MPRHVLSTLMLVLALAGRAPAHPHVFVDTEVGFDVTGTQLIALHISWTYDAFTTLVLFDTLELDKDGDGVLSAEDLAKVVEGETNWPPGYNGDIHLERGEAAVPLTRPVSASAEMQDDDRITVRFELPLATPVDLAGATATLRLYDPFYYYAYFATGLSHEPPEAGPCRAQVIPFEPDAAAAELQDQLAMLSREEVPEQENVGRLFADQVVLTCD